MTFARLAAPVWHGRHDVHTSTMCHPKWVSARHSHTGTTSAKAKSAARLVHGSAEGAAVLQLLHAAVGKRQTRQAHRAVQERVPRNGDTAWAACLSHSAGRTSARRRCPPTPDPRSTRSRKGRRPRPQMPPAPPSLRSRRSICTQHSEVGREAARAGLCWLARTFSRGPRASADDRSARREMPLMASCSAAPPPPLRVARRLQSNNSKVRASAGRA